MAHEKRANDVTQSVLVSDAFYIERIRVQDAHSVDRTLESICRNSSGMGWGNATGLSNQENQLLPGFYSQQVYNENRGVMIDIRGNTDASESNNINNFDFKDREN